MQNQAYCYHQSLEVEMEGKKTGA